MKRICVIGALAVFALPCQSATAATLFGTANSIGYVAAPGEANDLTIALEESAVTVRDPGAVIQLDVGNERCTVSPDGHAATCSADGLASAGGSLGDDNDQGRIGPVAPSVSMSGGDGNDLIEGTGERVTLRGGGGNDVLTATGAVNSLEGEDGDDVMTGDSTHPQGPRCQYMEINDRMDGGPGDDTLTAGAGADMLVGGPGSDRADGGQGCDLIAGDELEAWETPDSDYAGAGNDSLAGGDDGDRLYGGPGGDALNGGEGDDELHGGLGADAMSGGGGRDQVGYHRRTAPVTASLAGGTGFGEAGENDTFAGDMEVLHGGEGSDRLTGNAQVNTLVGRGGDDVIDVGGGRFDNVAAGGGSDVVVAYDGDKALDGPEFVPPGFNGTLPPGAGFPGYEGRDDLVSCDGEAPESLPGRDTAFLDPEDMPQGPYKAYASDMGCETIVFGPATTVIAPGQGTVTVPATCPDLSPACSGTVAVRALPGVKAPSAVTPKPRWKPVGRRAFRRKGKTGRKVTVKLSRRAVRSLTRRGKVRVFVTYEYKRQRARTAR